MATGREEEEEVKEWEKDLSKRVVGKGRVCSISSFHPPPPPSFHPHS